MRRESGCDCGWLAASATVNCTSAVWASEPLRLLMACSMQLMLLVAWQCAAWAAGGRLPHSTVHQATEAADCNPGSFGARGDNRTDDTVSIQRAIQACAGPRGGAVRLRAPGTYLSMPLTLPSHSTLVVEVGAVLIASPNIHAWPNSSHGQYCHTTPYEAKDPVYVPQLANFLWIGDTTDVTITGGGVIDGQGWRWWPLRKLPGDYWHNCRPKLVAGSNISHLVIRNITLRSSPMYVTALHELDGATITHVTIDSNPGYGYDSAPNTDGFNINGRNIYIGQSSVANGDDCVPIGPNSSNITVEDLTCTRGNGVVPIIWSQPGVIEDVVFRRIKMVSTHTAIAVKSLPSYLGTVRNILWEDIEIHDARGSAIMFNMFRQSDTSASVHTASQRDAEMSRTGLMRLMNCTIRNVIVTGAVKAGEFLCGNGTHECDGIRMENVTMSGVADGWTCQGDVDGTASDCAPQPCFT